MATTPHSVTVDVTSPDLTSLLAFAYATGRQDSQIDLHLAETDLDLAARLSQARPLVSALEFSRRAVRERAGVASFPELWHTMEAELR